MPTWDPRANDLFLKALEMCSAGERQEYLDGACVGDLALRAEVEALLEASVRAGNFLESPPAGFPSPLGGDAPGVRGGATVDDLIRECPGSVIGPYKLLQQIGEGGMGVVWMAEQIQPVHRKVALKVIKPGMDSKQVIARFEAERQALAMMDHVNIARVFDGGTTEAGRPYFVMELVHGVPITKYCDDNHLTPRERLELFVPVCQAIQHAHQKGIIHRDIKPSNVMVTLYDGKPVPKVIDFGVAKATEQKLTERTLFTQYGTMVGTLEYMSPEQAEMSALGVDTRSDIYSLGVLLYELLTGSTPLTHKRMKEAAHAEILRMIKEEEPPKPSTRLSDSGDALASISAQRHMEPAKLTKLMRGELDWIVMKTLDKDRNRRYETAKDFATDVQRYLDDEQVQACPPSALYRLRKFARRNKAAIGVAGMVLFFLVLVGSGAGWALRDREARELEIAQETARKLALTEDGIRQALERGTKSRAELHAILKKPGGVQQLLNQPARWELLIKTALGEIAQARQLAVRAGGSLDTECIQAMDKLEKEVTSDQADYDLARRLEKIRLDQASWVDRGFDHRKAADEYSKAFADFAVLSDDPATVAARIASSPIKDQLVAALDGWALVVSVLRNKGLTEQLLALTRQAAPDPGWGDRLRQFKVWGDQKALGKLVAQAPTTGLSPQALYLVGILLRDLDSPLTESWLRQAQAEHPADFWLNFGLAYALGRTNPIEAAGFYRVALAVRPGNYAVYVNLGKALHDQKKLPEAVAVLHKAIEIDPTIAAAYSNLGATLCDQKKLPEAIAALHKAIEIDPKYAPAHAGLGRVLREQKKLDEAIASYRTAIDFDPKYVAAHHNLGTALMDKKKLDEAIDSFRMAIKLEPKVAVIHDMLGKALTSQNKLDDAIAAHRTAIALDPEFAIAYHGLGNALMRQGKLDDAIAAFRTAIKLDPKLANAIANALGKKCWNLANNIDPKLRDPKRAVELGKEAVELAPLSGLAWQVLGWAEYRAGNWKASIEALEKSCKLQEGGTGDSYQWLFLAMAHWQLDHKDEARKWYDKVIESDGAVSPNDLRGARAEAAKLLKIKDQPKPVPKSK